MRSTYFIALLATILLAITAWYQSSAAQCPIPIAYRLGTVDPAFGITKEQALSYAREAEALWEDTVNRELFVYDEAAALPIEFRYDIRQASADSETAQRAALDAQKEQSEAIDASITELQTKYDQLSAAYETRVATYEAKLRAYNEEVNTHNDRGGAPPEVFERLEKERVALSRESTGLTQVSTELRELADKINALAEQGNQLVQRYNEGVVRYNEEFGFAREFTQGDYQGDQINIYKFSSDAEVVTVLAHEFGHALGIGHVEGNSSLMYYLLENTDELPTLSADDLASYTAVCGESESAEQKIRRMIRETLAVVK
jgi:uncharacterized phage infection (PIP) family protein YhgE